MKERYAFSAFGIRRIMAPDWSPRSVSECAFEFAFQGQFLDIESGLLNYGYRYYSPFLGSWTCKDPLANGVFLPNEFIESGPMVVGDNFYLFEFNRPSNLVDAYGLGFWTWLKNQFCPVYGIHVCEFNFWAGEGKFICGRFGIVPPEDEERCCLEAASIFIESFEFWLALLGSEVLAASRSCPKMLLSGV